MPNIKKVNLPELGEQIDQIEILSLGVEVGTQVNKETSILEAESDKATLEVPAGVNGIVKKVLVKVGETIKVGAALLEVEIIGEESATPAPPKAEATPAPSQAVVPEPIVPEPIAEQTVPPKTQATQAATKPDKPVSATAISSPQASHGFSNALVAAAPSVRRFAREIGVNIAKVASGSEHGRISVDDVKLHAKQTLAGGGAGTGQKSRTLPNFADFGEVQAEPMNRIKVVTAEQMSYAWNNIPQVTQQDQADVTELEVLRQKHKAFVEQNGGRLTVTAILVKMIAQALKKFPRFNSAIDVKNQQFIVRKFYNIGIAVETEQGLLVPVIRNVDQKNILEICQNLQDVSARARARKITPSELGGSCFTLSNLGGIAGTGFTPIVNWPEVGIVGVAKSRYQPVYVGEQLQKRLIMPIVVSYDHRAIDGAEAARFLQYLVQLLENPFLLNLAG